MQNNTTALPGPESPEAFYAPDATGNRDVRSTAEGSSSPQKQSHLTLISTIASIILGVGTIIAFCVHVIISQNDINNSLQNLSVSINKYYDDNVLIKSQIENWFNKMDGKLDFVKDEIKK